MVQIVKEYRFRLAHAMRLAGFDPSSSADIGKLAASVRVSYQAIKKVLDGTSKMMAADNNARAAKLLSVDSDWLATGEGVPAKPSEWPFGERASLLAVREMSSDYVIEAAGAINEVLRRAASPPRTPQVGLNLAASSHPDSGPTAAELTPGKKVANTRRKSNDHSNQN